MTNEKLETLLDAIDQQSNKNEIKEIVKEIFSAYGFDEWLFAIMLPSSMVIPYAAIITTYSWVWVWEYNLKRFVKVDPVVLHFHRGNVPLIWRADIPFGEVNGLDSEPFRKTLVAKGYTGGIVFPVQSSENLRGGVNLASKKPFETELMPLIREVRPVGLYIVHRIYEAVLRLTREDKAFSAVILSDREEACLRWASEGKTSEEIGIILGLQKRTIDHYMQTASEKLGVPNRQQAIAKAIATGVIIPSAEMAEGSINQWLADNEEISAQNS